MITDQTRAGPANEDSGNSKGNSAAERIQAFAELPLWKKSKLLTGLELYLKGFAPSHLGLIVLQISGIATQPWMLAVAAVLALVAASMVAPVRGEKLFGLKAETTFFWSFNWRLLAYLAGSFCGFAGLLISIPLTNRINLNSVFTQWPLMQYFLHLFAAVLMALLLSLVFSRAWQVYCQKVSGQGGVRFSYRQRKRLYLLKRDWRKVFFRKLVTGYEIGLRSIAPVMALSFLYSLFWGPLNFVFQLAALLVAVNIAAAYWARKNYGLYLKTSYYWSFTWRFLFYWMVAVFAIAIAAFLILLALRLYELMALVLFLASPVLVMMAAGIAAVSAYWLSVKPIPVSLLVENKSGIDEELEDRIFRSPGLGSTSWDERNQLPWEKSYQYKMSRAEAEINYDYYLEDYAFLEKGGERKRAETWKPFSYEERNRLFHMFQTGLRSAESRKLLWHFTFFTFPFLLALNAALYFLNEVSFFIAAAGWLLAGLLFLPGVARRKFNLILHQNYWLSFSWRFLIQTSLFTLVMPFFFFNLGQGEIATAENTTYLVIACSIVNLIMYTSSFIGTAWASARGIPSEKLEGYQENPELEEEIEETLRGKNQYDQRNIQLVAGTET